MKLRMAVGICVMMLVGAAGVWVHAQDATSADKPKKSASGRLTQPWSKISTLTDDQKTKIRDIHAKAVSDKKAIDDKERSDCLAVLNDEQKAEAEKLMAEQSKSKSSGAAETTEKKGDPSNEKKVEEKKKE
jgi:Spy/CpxP family protein refolding chaperone